MKLQQTALAALKSVRTFIPALFISLIGIASLHASTTMKLSLRVEPSPWGSGQFENLLHEAIDRSFGNRELRWERVEDGWLIAQTEEFRDPDKKTKRQPEAMRSLLVSIVVQPYELVTRKTFDASGLFHSYGVFGEAHTHLRIIERSSGKILADEEIFESKRGPRVLQLGIDGDKYDPDLQMTALVKHRFFETLEQSSADSVAARLASLVN